jgi:cation:H+ antiporter
MKNDSASHGGKLDPLYMTKYLNLGNSEPVIMIQLAIALAGIIFGAEIFVRNIEDISSALGISALVLSLVIAPVATELPEKFNSVIWISKKKDTLAMGNLTGAMVFQSCIPVSIGILFTNWHLDIKVLVSAALALSSTMVTYLWMKVRGKLTPFPLLMGGLFYASFIVFLVLKRF